MSYIEELKELAKLKDDGILTDEEFQKKKEEILSSSPESEPLAKQDPSTRPEEAASKKKKGFFDMLFGKVEEEILDTTASMKNTIKDNFVDDILSNPEARAASERLKKREQDMLDQIEEDRKRKESLGYAYVVWDMIETNKVDKWFNEKEVKKLEDLFERVKNKKTTEDEMWKELEPFEEKI